MEVMPQCVVVILDESAVGYPQLVMMNIGDMEHVSKKEKICFTGIVVDPGEEPPRQP